MSLYLFYMTHSTAPICNFVTEITDDKYDIIKVNKRLFSGLFWKIVPGFWMLFFVVKMSKAICLRKYFHGKFKLFKIVQNCHINGKITTKISSNKSFSMPSHYAHKPDRIGIENWKI